MVRQQMHNVPMLHVHCNLSGFQETHCTFMLRQVASPPYHRTCWFPFFLSCRKERYSYTRGPIIVMMLPKQNWDNFRDTVLSVFLALLFSVICKLLVTRLNLLRRFASPSRLVETSCKGVGSGSTDYARVAHV